MLVSQSNPDTQRSRSNKENLSPLQALKSIVSRNEQALIQVRRELKQKVNRSDFLSSISSKVSLSDITTLTNISEIQQQEAPLRQLVKEQVEREVSMALKIIQNENKAEISYLSKTVQELRCQLQHVQKQISCEQVKIKQLRQSQQTLSVRVQQKAQRSQLDKMMHLSSLLAIQFQLIKKRFGTFQLDYNLVWKEISALYSQQDSLRSVFETQQKDSMENTRQKQLQVLLKTCKDQNIVAKLFEEKERDREEMEPFDRDHEDQSDLRKRLDGMQHAQRDQQFSIKNLLERLMTVEKDYDNHSQFLRQIKQLKKDYNDSREEVVFLQQKCRNLKKQTLQMVEQQCKSGVNQLESSIGQEIRQACEEITTKMMHLFQQCVKQTENDALKRDIDAIEQQTIERIDEINEIFRKNVNSVNIRLNLHQDKLRIIEKDMNKRLKIQQFEQLRQNLITYDASQTIIKKTQSQLKRQISQFKQSQKVINEVICSQNILCRWVWVSGQLKCGNLISWDRQVVNTLPNNFIFLPSQGVFRIVSSGIYRVQMAFYSKKKPSIQIIINGKTIVSAVNSSSYVVHHSSGKLKDISNSEISGLAYYDFFSLQENSRLAISYSGEQGHGFLGMQRL